MSLSRSSDIQRVHIQRVWLFARDYLRELRQAHGMAWSMARMDDCLRSGGHYWGDWGPGAIFHDCTLPGEERVCSQCETSEWRRDGDG